MRHIYLFYFFGLLMACNQACGAINLRLELDRTEDFSPSRTDNNWRVYGFVDDPSITTYSFRSQTGAFYGSGPAGTTQSAQRPSFAALSTALDGSGPWTFTFQTASGVSTYRATPQLTQIDPAKLVDIDGLIPGPGQTTFNHRPTFRWTQTGGPVTDGILQIISSTTIRNIEGISGPGVTPPFDLVNDNYDLVVSYASAPQSVELASALVSGPDLGGLTATVEFSYVATSTFQVVPEADAAVLFATAIVLLSTCRLRSESPN